MSNVISLGSIPAIPLSSRTKDFGTESRKN